MLRTLNIAKHTIVAINEVGFEVKSAYKDVKNHVIDFNTAKNHFITLEECIKTYPEIMLKSRVNGP